MSRVDIVIFGATGFTGKHAVLEMVRVGKKHPELTWAVAGRSQTKLESLMREVAETTGEEQSHIKIIIADVSDEESLKLMCAQSRVIANCCGPYRQFGEPVVRAAILSRCHYVDVTGEPQFIETMQLKYDALAREAGVYVVNACGLDSVPADLGVLYVQQNFGGTVNAIESYMSLKVAPSCDAEARARGFIHYGTWDSLLQSIAHMEELKPLRKKLYPDRLPNFEPKLEKRFPIHRRTASSHWSLPFPGADNSVVYRSQRALHERDGLRPAQFKAYLTIGSLLHAIMVAIGAVLLFVVARFEFLKELALQHPRLFSLGLVSREGPTKAVMENSTFHVTLHADGWDEGSDVKLPPNKKMKVKVSGRNPGYGATVTALLYCALTVLKESANMPDKGGVLTTAVAFQKTNLIKNLHENDLTFEVVETSTI